MKKNRILNASKLFIITIFALTISANAQTSADLDPDFFGGRVLSRFINNEQGYATAIQADGKIVVAGQTQNGTNGSDFFVARYTADGVLDRTFANFAGWIGANFGTGFNEVAPDVAIAPDGKIVVAGRTCANPCVTPQIAVARFTSAGNLDRLFSGVIGNQSFGYSVAVQSDGKIVVVGEAAGTGVAGNSQGDIANMAIFRFSTNGNLDATFDGDGIVTTDFFPANQSNSSMRAIAIQADGKIVVGGTSNSLTGSPGDDNFALARYNSNGSLDTTFSGDGMIVLDISTSSDHVHGLAIHDSGKIVVSGDAFIGGNYDVALVQLNSDGTLDNTFGTNGISTTNISGNDYGYAVATLSNGKIVVAGDYNDTSSRFVARYNANGTLDNSFDGDGINSSILFRSPESTQSFRGLALQSDGKPVVVGTSISSVAIARLTTNGTLDGTFGNRSIRNFGTSTNEQIKAIAVKSDGKIIVAGYTLAATIDFLLAQYNADGTLDANFGNNGSRIIGFTDTGGNPTGDLAEAVKIQSDGKIVVAGTNNSGGECQIARLNVNGTLDNSFSGDGLVKTNLISGCYGMAIQPDGKILTAGTAGTNFAGVAAARFNIDGSLDTSFGGGDGVATAFGTSPSVSGGGLDVAVQNDGKIVVVGSYSPASLLAYVRFNSNGTLDTSFSGDGTITTSVFVSNSFTEASVALQTDGKIVAGFPTAPVGMTSQLDFGLFRVNADGSVDTGFGNSGSVRTDFGSTGDFCSGVGIQSDGKIVAVGTYSLGLTPDFAMARYNTDGSLDTTFDLTANGFADNSLIGDGKVITDMGGSNDVAFSMAIQPDDKIIAGGYSFMPGGNAFSFVRYRGLLAPSAANVSVSGRVFTSDGIGLRNAIVQLTDANGATRTVRTSSFGYYSFDEIPVGQTYIISVISKRYVFNPQVISVAENINDLDFIAMLSDLSEK